MERKFKTIFLFLVTVFIFSCSDEAYINQLSSSSEDVEEFEEIESSEINLSGSVTSYSSQCSSEDSLEIELDDEDEEVSQTDRTSLDCQVNFLNNEVEMNEDSSVSESLSSLIDLPDLISLPILQKLKLFLIAEIESPLVNSDYLGATDVNIVVGTLEFSDEHSANAISYDGDYLLVASGIGGVKIIKSVMNPYLFSIDCNSLDIIFCEDFSLNDGDEIDSDDSQKWEGQENRINSTIVNEGGRLNEDKWIRTINSFDLNDDGAHYSIKLFNSSIYKAVKSTSIGTMIQYDGQSSILGIVGNTNSKSKRKVVSFEFPEGQEYVVIHIYQRGENVQLVVDLADGTRMNSPIIESPINNIDDPLKIRLEPYDNNAQPENEPSFDDVLVEAWSDDFIGSETL